MHTSAAGTALQLASTLVGTRQARLCLPAQRLFQRSHFVGDELMCSTHFVEVGSQLCDLTAQFGQIAAQGGQCAAVRHRSPSGTWQPAPAGFPSSLSLVLGPNGLQFARLVQGVGNDVSSPLGSNGDY